ncbi:DMT family transporter [Candidatus Persebacteraceae bacterium Df01]|jgi:drug/metabolite transporter (DMT)-like permease|uniref:DMT family transporter n=1 Tax=Candidatus Doriopsillibacter californiensis TaxID=2970740 RepID=A0ABT7QNB1_9GAMM|nr:DMT family transporter [Candidatus Persebacteraceae bacterium Df01]
MKKQTSDTRIGLFIGVAGILILSPDALLLRLFDGEDLTLTTGRSAFMAISIGALLLFFPSLRAGFQWSPVLLYSVIYAIGMFAFPMSIRHTHVANTLVIMTIAPLFAAIGARIFLHEPVARRTWLACIATTVGIAVIFIPQTKSGGLLGDILALGVALSLAGCAIVIRRHPHTMMFPGLFFGAILSAIITAPFANWELSSRDFIILAVDGGFTIPVSFMLIIAASRRLSPPEINLLFLLETALAPLWVWLALGEKPPATTTTAGVFIIAVLLAHFIATLKATDKAK